MFLWWSKALQGLFTEWKSSCHAVWQHHPRHILHFRSYAHQLLLWFHHQWQWLPGWIYGHSWVLYNKIYFALLSYTYSIFQCYPFGTCTKSNTVAINNHILLSKAYCSNIIYSNISFDIIYVQGYTLWELMNLGTGMPVALAVTLTVDWGCLPMAGMPQSSIEYKNVEWLDWKGSALFKQKERFERAPKHTHTQAHTRTVTHIRWMIVWTIWAL